MRRWTRRVKCRDHFGYSELEVINVLPYWKYRNVFAQMVLRLLSDARTMLITLIIICKISTHLFWCRYVDLLIGWGKIQGPMLYFVVYLRVFYAFETHNSPICQVFLKLNLHTYDSFDEDRLHLHFDIRCLNMKSQIMHTIHPSLHSSLFVYVHHHSGSCQLYYCCQDLILW